MITKESFQIEFLRVHFIKLLEENKLKKVIDYCSKEENIQSIDMYKYYKEK